MCIYCIYIYYHILVYILFFESVSEVSCVKCCLRHNAPSINYPSSQVHQFSLLSFMVSPHPRTPPSPHPHTQKRLLGLALLPLVLLKLCAFVHHYSPNHGLYKPVAGSYSKTTGVDMLWRTTVLQTIVFISPLRGRIRKQKVLICFGAQLFSKP